MLQNVINTHTHRICSSFFIWSTLTRLGVKAVQWLRAKHDGWEVVLHRKIIKVNVHGINTRQMYNMHTHASNCFFIASYVLYVLNAELSVRYISIFWLQWAQSFWIRALCTLLCTSCNLSPIWLASRVLFCVTGDLSWELVKQCRPWFIPGDGFLVKPGTVLLQLWAVWLKLRWLVWV